jgi:hypothetical protein
MLHCNVEWFEVYSAVFTASNEGSGWDGETLFISETVIMVSVRTKMSRFSALHSEGPVLYSQSEDRLS